MQTLKVNLAEFLQNLKLPEGAKAFILKARKVAKEQGKFLYIAGGEVRDFLLKRPSSDVDLVLEGEVEDFLEALRKEASVEILFVSPFLTYKLYLKEENLTVDLVCARGEVYPEVTALPKVYRATFKEDILRRDFTINALIYGLSPPYEELIVDLYGGLSDLERGLLRPLHLMSFVDDPTRVLRGVRYKVRFGLAYADEFYLALEKGRLASSLRKLSPSRLRNELSLMVKREDLSLLRSLVEDIAELSLFSLFGLEVELERLRSGINFLAELKPYAEDLDLKKAFLLLVGGQKRENLERLFFPESEIQRVLSWYQRFGQELREFFCLPLVERVILFDRIEPEVLIALACYVDEVRAEVRDYFLIHRNVRPKVRGADLLELGFEPGKRVGEMLKLLRAKKLEGKLKTKEEELAFVQSLLSQTS